MSSSLSKISPHIFVFKLVFISPFILFSILWSSLKTKRQKWTWERSYLETCLRLASELKVVWVRLFWIVEAVFGSEQFLAYSIAATVPILPAAPPFKNVNLLIFFGVFIVFLFNEVSCLLFAYSSSYAPLILHWVPVIPVDPVKKEWAVLACELEVPTTQSNLCI